MQQGKGIKGQIPKLYKLQALDLLLFAYIQGMQDALPAVNDGQAIEMFYRKYGLSEDDLGQDYARSRISQIRAMFYEL